MANPQAIFVMVIPEAREYAGGPAHFRWWYKVPGGQATSFAEGEAGLKAAAEALIRAGWNAASPVNYSVSTGVNETKDIPITLGDLARLPHRDLFARPGTYID